MVVISLGYKLSSEEFGAPDLVRAAARAERAGFEFALISDHFHPWTDRQGQSPFVWSVLGAIAQVTSRLRVGTAVTCPLVRIHPAIVAQAAATTATLFGERFFLGLGTGENLNEHVVGRGWPSPGVRIEMLEEAIEVLQLLWRGGMQSFHGAYYTVEDARLYSLPEMPPALLLGASKPHAAELAARTGAAMINPAIAPDLVRTFRQSGGKDRPCYVEMTVFWAKDEARARRTAHEVWGLAALEGMLFTELPTPALFEAALAPVTEERVAEAAVCGPDPAPYLAKIREAADAGYTHVCLHQVGAEQDGFIDFFRRRLLPEMTGRRGKPRRPKTAGPRLAVVRGGRKRASSAR